MQEVWANLLANAADPRHEDLVLPSFPSILKEMVSRDARFIDALYSRARQQRAQPYFSATGITFDESNLLDVYAGAGLSREPQLTKLSAEYRTSHKEALDADFNAFDLTLGLALRQNVLTKEEVPIPLRLRGMTIIGRYRAFWK